MISCIFFFLAAICSAIMDNLSQHWFKSKFKKFNNQWWNPEISWKNKYINGDWKNGEKHIFIYKFIKIKYPIILTDAWHFFKFLMVFCIVLATTTYTPFLGFFIDVLLLGLVWILTFNIFYDKVLIK